MEIGVMFWAGRDNLAELRVLGVQSGQLGVGGDAPLTSEAAVEWREAIAEAGFSIATVVCAYTGEDYADIPTVQRTVGFIPAATREARENRTIQACDFAAALGVKSIACHIGFVPEDRTDPDYIAVRGMVRRICDRAEKHGQTFALETGQESADTLLRFLDDAGCPNLKINFDPANMILYGSGDPIEALEKLAPHVVSVHAKDGDGPPADKPGALGTEKPLGQGAVGIPRFVDALQKAGYKGSINVEREIENQAQRLADIGMGVRLLRSLGV
ncbi:MAG TPA: sugar phosphate isomerase/epimerase family protein [Bryobacteraceae bacterium]|jgi:L-ribulose-5-phosphate 3-epimerase|nr:sugar phosphate isomerase/epimerase family protein [Bryobacteraceae bacterium]